MTALWNSIHLMTEGCEETHRNWGTEITICQLLELLSRSGKLPSGNGIQDTFQHYLATAIAGLWCSTAQVTAENKGSGFTCWRHKQQPFTQRWLVCYHENIKLQCYWTSPSRCSCDFSHNNIIHSLPVKKCKIGVEIMTERSLVLLLQRPQQATFISFASRLLRRQAPEYKLSANKLYKRSQCKLSLSTGKMEHLLALWRDRFVRTATAKMQLEAIKPMNILLLPIG